MNPRTLLIRWLAPCVAATLVTSVNARVVKLFGRPEPGHAVPPLWQNLGPFGHGGGPGPAAASVYYNPGQIRHAYGFDQLTADGTGQTIAIVDAYGSSTIQSDLDTFCATVGIPTTTVAISYPQGQPKRSNTGWAEETSLDVEWAHAIAPGAKIALVVAKSNSFSDLLGAVDYAVSTVHASVVSMSWGGSEFSGETSSDYHFNQAGVTFCASAGDSGAVVEWPAASPYVVGVGGTSLYLDQSNNRTSETAWSSSGGGISAYEALPSWQVGWSSSLTSTRGVPDISYVADPNTGVEVIYNGGLYVFGGTSVGAPQWSALVALVNQGRSSALSSADAAIYGVANGGSYTINAANLFDITAGSNGYPATSGYDLVTGVGSPVAQGVVPALVAWGSSPPPPPTPDFTLSVSPSSQSVAPSGNTSYTVTVAPSGGYNGTVNLSVSGTGYATASFSPTSIANGSGSATLNVTAGSTLGTFTLTITGTDSTGSPTHSASVTLVIANTATTMTVSSIKYSTSGHNGANLDITLAVVDNFGNPVPSASVSITLDLNGAAYAAGTGTTGSNGQVTFMLRNAPSGTYTTVVTSVNASGLNWDGTTPPNSFTKN